MKWKSLCVLFIITGAFLLAGCQSGENQPGQPSAIAPETLSPTSSPTSALPNTGNPLSPLPGVDETLTPPTQKLVSLAQERLANKYQKPAEDFRLFSIVAVDWPDSSLGCPQPAMNYQPVITPGYQMVFESGRQTYVVHSDDQDTVVLCEARAPDEIYPTP